MALFLGMLIAAMVPTAQDNWNLKPDYAIYYFYSPKVDRNLSFISMILSTLLLSIGFLVRVVRLHRRLSVDIMGSARRVVSVLLRRGLSAVYYKQVHPGDSPSWFARHRILFARRRRAHAIRPAWGLHLGGNSLEVSFAASEFILKGVFLNCYEVYKKSSHMEYIQRSGWRR